MSGFLLSILVLTISPAEARRQPLGSVVTVRGYVMVAPGAFESFRSDPGFVLGDARAGLYVVTPQRERLVPADAVEAEGTLAEDHGLLILRATAVRWRPGRRKIPARSVPLRSVGEATEGLLLRVEGRLDRAAQPDPPYGYKIFVRDHQGQELQVFLPAQLDPATLSLKPGARLRVTGWCAQYDATYEVVPRNARDVVVR